MAFKAIGSSPCRIGKNGVGEVDIPITFGNMTFQPGDWVYSDEDGIVVSAEELPA